MVKITFCLRRRPELTPEDFTAYWRDEHAPIVRANAAAIGMRRYVQSHPAHTTLDAGLAQARDAPEPFDGIAEVWFDSIEALQAAVRTPEGRAASIAMIEDERRFIDFARSPIWTACEHVVIGDETAAEPGR